jgi:hypothetical protein
VHSELIPAPGSISNILDACHISVEKNIDGDLADLTPIPIPRFPVGGVPSIILLPRVECFDIHINSIYFQ